MHVIKNAQPESAAICRMIATLSLGTQPLGYNTSVVCLGEAGPLQSDLEQTGANVRTVRWNGARRTAVLWHEFYSAMRNERPDIVHVHHGGLAVRLLSRAAGARAVVQQVHSRVLECSGESVSNVKLGGADSVIAVSKAVASQVNAKSVEVIYPGVQCAGHPVPLRPKEYLLLGIAGRLVPLKGIHIMIQALAKLVLAGHPVRLQIAGDGPEGSSLRQQVHALRMDAHIEFIGWLPDLTAIRENWDLAVLPSLEEGFGMSALEAMAIGRAALVSHVGGLPELIDNNVNGMLVAPGDADSLASAIVKVIADRQLLASMGISAWEKARSHFSSTLFASRTAAVYDRLLGRIDAHNASF